MRKNPAVCIASCTFLCAAGVALSACSSDQLPPLSARAALPSQVQPLPPLNLSGGQAVKAFIDPVTGELRDPSEVERAGPERAGNQFRTLDRPEARWSERDLGIEIDSAPGVVTRPAECGKAHSQRSAAHRCGSDGSQQR